MCNSGACSELWPRETLGRTSELSEGSGRESGLQTHEQNVGVNEVRGKFADDKRADLCNRSENECSHLRVNKLPFRPGHLRVQPPEAGCRLPGS